MTRSGKLSARTVRADSLTPGEKEQMWDIFDRYYADVSRPLFERDLASKDHVILVSDTGDGSLQGFSTLHILREVVGGRPVVAIFSGDTIIEKEYWGQSALQRAFFNYIVKLMLTNPGKAVYWFLISKGYRTYLLLSRNFVEYWPRHDKPTPPWQTAVLDALARRKFGASWKPELGILRFAECMGRLRETVALPLWRDPWQAISTDVAFSATSSSWWCPDPAAKPQTSPSRSLRHTYFCRRWLRGKPTSRISSEPPTSQR